MDARQTFVGIWIRALLEGNAFDVWGGEQKRDFTFVDDCVNAFCMAAKSDFAVGRIFNLGADCHVSLQQLAAKLVTINGGGEYRIRHFPEDRKKIDIGDYYSDDGSIRRELGWCPAVSLDEGLHRTLDYFRSRLDKYV